MKLIIFAGTMVMAAIILQFFGLAALKASVPFLSFAAIGLFLAIRIPEIINRYSGRDR
jgi:hypothetical protein